MAGDIYGAPPYTGRGGWSWYTGSAAWMYRAATESLFGLEFGPQRVCFRPCFPAHWEHAHMHLQLPKCVLEVSFVKDQPDAPLAAAAEGSIALAVGAWLEYLPLRGVQQIQVAI